MDILANSLKKKKFQFPHTYVIIVVLIFFAILLTWIVPAGEFDRVKDVASGKKIIVAGTYKIIESKPISFLSIPLKIVEGMNKASNIVFVVLVVGGAFNVILKTGMFQALTGKITKHYGHNEAVIIPAFTITFAIACMSMGVNTFIGFAPVAIILARSLGYDAVVGVAMVALGGAIGFSTGTFNPFTTGVAQAIAGLPMFSGVGYRIFCMIVFLVVTNIYIIWYAKKVKANPELSVVRDLELQEMGGEKLEHKEHNLEKRHFLVLAVVLSLFGLLIYGGSHLHWSLDQTGALFLWMAILGGLAYGFTANEIASAFVEGSKKLIFGALIIGFARAISLILTEGMILDTTVYHLGNMLGSLPAQLQSVGMFLMQLVINGLLTSGSGQAAVTMPIMLPVSDLIGMTRQTAVLAFNFGDGLSNYILPTSSALMGFLAIANIGYDKWMKFMWRLFLIWVVTGSILVVIATQINYGPF
ncbi:YfcC family protein [uncultured Ilyobacter sp.]|uniref:YfcC family protein n=1 Tax=uncultured Ilyobacter sp. TaxID=544433 RepID=UPI0029C6004F|nr:YfcC family protein [uncultured Ilyobacter sp.]